MDKEKGNEKTPQYILVDGIEHPASHGKVKRDLGKDGKQKNPFEVLSEILGMKIPLHDQKCKNRKSESSNACQPILSWHNGAPKMVE